MRLFGLKIVTADGEFFNGQAQRVVVRSIDGDVCVMAGHIPYLTALGMGECRVTGEDGQMRRAACIGGMLSFLNNEAHIVATTFEWAEDIDVERAQRAKARAEALLAQKQLNARELELANAKLKRALTRSRIGSGK